MRARRIDQRFKATATPEGAGVTVHRSIGTRELNVLDPFLLLDEFIIAGDAKGAGFPDHPHRGFETVTYMLSGRMEHADSAGNAGVIGPGEVQWMTAGAGLVHSEMPRPDGKEIRGIQLWVNLPAAEKMCPPHYQDIKAKDIPEIGLDGGGAVRVIAGRFEEAEGPVADISVRPMYLDIRLGANDALTIPIGTRNAAFLYCLEGEFAVDNKADKIEKRELAVLTEGDRVLLTSDGRPARTLLVGAEPIGEPIARYGPFVMNSRQEIARALKDFGWR